MPSAHARGFRPGEIVHLARRHVGGRVVGEDIVAAVRTVLVVAGRFEPGMVAAGVVQHIVHVDADAFLSGLVDQLLEVGFRAEPGIDDVVVDDIVAVVGHGGLDRREPEGAHAQALEVIQMLGDALEIAPAVPVGVGEAVDVDLVGDIGKAFSPLDLRCTARDATHVGLVAGEEAECCQHEAGQDRESSHIACLV